MNDPLGVSPSKRKQGTTRGKEKIFWPRWESQAAQAQNTRSYIVCFFFYFHANFHANFQRNVTCDIYYLRSTKNALLMNCLWDQ